MGANSKNKKGNISISIPNKIFRKYDSNINAELIYRNSYELRKMIREIFVDEVYKPVKELQISSVLDLGSNIGISVLYFLKMFNSCNIYSYEPNPVSFALQYNNLSNYLSKVVFNNSAVTIKRKSTETLYCPSEDSPYQGRSWGGSLIKGFWADEQNSVKFPVLATCASNIFKSHYDFCKIDIEGYELDLITYLFANKLFTNCNYYIVEYHVTKRNTITKLKNILKNASEQGYEATIFRKGKKYSIEEVKTLGIELPIVHLFKS